VFLLLTAPVATADNILRFASADGVLTWDPHGAWVLPSYWGYSNVYEALVGTDVHLKIEPELAVGWRMVDPNNWRFELREGVVFHDGAPLGADDVVFSIDRARADTSDLADSLNAIGRVRAIDAKTIEITTTRPMLSLLVLIGDVGIMSKSWAERHGVATATMHDRDQGTYAHDHADGTGPFALESHTAGQRTVLVRNQRWWGWNDQTGSVDRVEWSLIPDRSQRLAALLDGKIDFVIDPPLDRLERIRDAPGLKLEETWMPRVAFLGLNQGSAELSTSDIKGRNPFKDRRVRQAIYQGIDIEAIRDKALDGHGVPTGMLVAPNYGGYIPELDLRLPYDPKRAQALLAEAGYPGGFAVRLDCPQSRFEGPSVCPEIADQLARISVRITVDLLSEEERFARIHDQTTDLYLHNEYASSLDSLEVLRQYHSRPSKEGATGYANPRLDGLIERLEQELTTTYARDALFEEAWRIILDDIVVVPLFRPVVVWAMRENVELPIGVDNVPYFFTARLKPVQAD
jgi:peptide/nickel transport system substrate-binding protein